MMDIVERLLGLANLPYTDRAHYGEWREAANEIERLRAALYKIGFGHPINRDGPAYCQIAREALKPHQE